MENIVPVFTPFLDDDKQTINYDVIPKYAEHLKTNKIHHILVNGTTGEGPSLTLLERKQIVEVWMKESQRLGLQIMVQVGGTNLVDILDLATHAVKVGAHSILVLPSIYFRPETVDEMVVYYEKICRAVPKMPVFMYHFPGITNVRVSLVEFMKRMVPITNFAGFKYTSDAMVEGFDIVNLDKKRFKVYLGCDQAIVGGFALGFAGVIPASLNLFPKRIFKIQELLARGDLEGARVAQLELNHAIEKATKHGFWLSTMKEAMNIMTPIKMGHPRLPILPIKPKVVEEMKMDLKNEM